MVFNEAQGVQQESTIIVSGARGTAEVNNYCFWGKGCSRSQQLLFLGEGVQQKSTIIVSGGRGAAEFV